MWKRLSVVRQNQCMPKHIAFKISSTCRRICSAAGRERDGMLMSVRNGALYYHLLFLGLWVFRGVTMAFYNPRCCNPSCLDISVHKSLILHQRAERTHRYATEYKNTQCVCFKWISRHWQAIPMGMIRYVSNDSAISSDVKTTDAPNWPSWCAQSFSISEWSY